MIARVEKSFPRSAACLPEIFEFMEAFFEKSGIAEPHRNPAEFAVEELFTNLVKYSRGGKREIQIALAREADRLVVSLTDFDVEPFDIRSVPDAKIDLGIDQRKPGGLGIHLVRRMVDEIDYRYEDGRSTTTFVKSLE
jgi:serine/threonine-protein kinase RsbW